jgi:hypothetical protein
MDTAFGTDGEEEARLYIDSTQPKSSLLHNLKSVPLALTGDTS